MTWARKYWDIIDQIYWWPPYIGLTSISQKKWVRKDGFVCVPEELVNQSGPLYSRGLKIRELIENLHSKEEILNHFFDLTFSIAGDITISSLLFKPIGFKDGGPFENLGREVQQRYGWGEDNVSQQDGFFVSSKSILAVELKLGARSTPAQILKYASMIAWEEQYSGRKENIGLLYIVPESAVEKHWQHCGLASSEISAEYLNKFAGTKVPKRVRDLIENDSDMLNDVLNRMRLEVTTWNDLVSRVAEIEASLNRQDQGDQALINLLRGFRNQVEAHKGT